MPEESFVACAGYVAETCTRKGLGVFANRHIRAGEVVEVAPVIEIATPFDAMDPTLRRRVFDWERLARIRGTCVVALGYGSIYNHANPANLRYAACLGGAGIRFSAAREIRCGEELTINYNATLGAPISDDDVWFRELGVEPFQSDGRENA